MTVVIVSQDIMKIAVKTVKNVVISVLPVLGLQLIVTHVPIL